MSAIFEKFTDTLSFWYDSLSERERRLLNIMLIVLFLITIFGSLFMAKSKLDYKTSSLAKNKVAFEEIVNLESSYLEAKKKHEEAIASINQNDVSLFSVIPAVASRLNLTLSDLSEKSKPIPKTQIVEMYVNLNLRKLSIDKLIALIEAIEEADEDNQIKITKLSIKKSFDEPDLLDVQMTVSTWKSA